MKTKTTITENGKTIELEKYDLFREKVDKIAVYFREITEYEGYPLLPNSEDLSCLDLMKIYDNASDKEKRFIASTATDLVVTLLRHWKVDRDQLWGKGKWDAFLYDGHI